MTQSTEAITRLLDIMARLRDPEHGCPWDSEQTMLSLLSYTLEEAYEVADAIEQGHDEEVPKELGDLLFQVIFYCQIAQEEGSFDFEQVVTELSDKLERRHPHVFGEHQISKQELEQVWHQSKAKERQEKELHSALDDVPLSLPALTRAQKLQRRAANEGFDWPDHIGVLDKMQEEILELKTAISNNDASEIEDEMGDLLFTAVNLSRHLEQDSESCLRRASIKFERRFRRVEELIAKDNTDIKQLSIEQMDAYWKQAKQEL